MDIKAIAPVNVSQASNMNASARKKDISAQPAGISYIVVSRLNNENKNHDSFENSQSPENLAAKYDLACRLAAYYKTEYDKLANGGDCVA